MMRLALLLALAAPLAAQQSDLNITILGTGKNLTLAVPDFRGDPQAQPLMAAFNETLWRDLDDSAVFTMAPKSMYPAQIPQLASDVQPREWSSPPVQAVYLAIGYTAVQNGTLRLRAWLMDVRNPTASGAQVFEKSYGLSPDAAGARQAAHQFAADILARLGVPSLIGTHIYYVHESRPAPDRLTEIWMMDYDGSNQHPVVRGNAVYTEPAVSPDGTRLAFAEEYPRHRLLLYSLDPARPQPFANPPDVSAVGSPSFTPDGQHILWAQSRNSRGTQIMIANRDGSNPHALTGLTTTDVEPKLNPKSGAQIAFVSGRAGPQQIYLMNADGIGVERITEGTGEASNPSWHPNGEFLAFAWTRGFSAGTWNIFVMDVARHDKVQLTHSEGRNENPVWAPDGRHLVFMSTRTGKLQIWSMAADGTHLHQLTAQGVNSTPTWGK